MLSGSPSRASAGQSAARCFSSRRYWSRVRAVATSFRTAATVQWCSRSGSGRGEDLPRFVAVLTEDGDVSACGRARRRASGVVASGAREIARAPAGPTASEGQLLAARRLVEDGEGFAPEDVRVPGQFEQGDGALDVGGADRRLAVRLD